MERGRGREGGRGMEGGRERWRGYEAAHAHAHTHTHTHTHTDGVDDCERFSMFNCSKGGCVKATLVCDGTRDCPHEDDDSDEDCRTYYTCVQHVLYIIENA